MAGQFTSADTTLAGGLNRYAYVAGNPETATDPSGHALTTANAEVAGALEGDMLGGGLPPGIQRAFANDDPAVLNPDLPLSETATSVTANGTTYAENADGSLTVTQTSAGQFARLDTYGQLDAGYKTLLGLFLSALNGVNTAAALRASQAQHQSNAFTAENDQPTPTPSAPNPASGNPGGADEGAATEPAPQPATGGAGAMHGSGSDMCGCGSIAYVIGESMSRVISAAEARGQRYYQPWPQERATNDLMTRDRNWLLWVMRQGYWIRDIGYDTKRVGRSEFYQMERDLIAEREYPSYCFDPQP